MSERLELLPGYWAMAEGTLWVPGERTLVAADLHLGYAWAQRRRGQLGPLVEGGIGTALRAALAKVPAERLLLLGDIVHAPSPSAEERALILSTLRELGQQVAVHAVLGNHDRRLLADLPEHGLVMPSGQRDNRVYEGAQFRALHGDELPAERPDTPLLLGHFHPAVRLKASSGAGIRARAFLVAGPVVVLPAFSPFAAGCVMQQDMPDSLREFLRPHPIQAVACLGGRLAPLPRAIGLRRRRRGPELPPWRARPTK